MPDIRHRAELPREAVAAGQARRLLAEWIGRELEPDELDQAKLVSTELVNNAVLHGQGAIELQVELGEHRLLIEVIDEGRGFEHAVRQTPFEELGGRGLAIVDAESSRWGIHEGTTHVWAELERRGPRLGEDAKPEVAS